MCSRHWSKPLPSDRYTFHHNPVEVETITFSILYLFPEQVKRTLQQLSPQKHSRTPSFSSLTCINAEYPGTPSPSYQLQITTPIYVMLPLPMGNLCSLSDLNKTARQVWANKLFCINWCWLRRLWKRRVVHSPINTRSWLYSNLFCAAHSNRLRVHSPIRNLHEPSHSIFTAILRSRTFFPFIYLFYWSRADFLGLFMCI